MKWPKSEEKLENGGRLGPLRQDSPPPKNDPLDPPLFEGAWSPQIWWREHIGKEVDQICRVIHVHMCQFI